MNQKPATLFSLLIFGSQVRADADSMSDVDVLAIVDNNAGVIPESQIIQQLPIQYQSRATISWYGKERIANMFKDGHLFAWHLHHESILLYDRDSFFKLLGDPATYPNAAEDVQAFLSVLKGISSAIDAAPANLVYELGLLYVCARNIAMAASWHLNAKPDFSRYSPFNLSGVSQPPFSTEEYKVCMLARMASQRGSEPSLITAGDAMHLSSRMLDWGYKVLGFIQGERLCA